MGCNTSQELKTKDGGAIDAVSNGEPEPSAPQMELDDGGDSCAVKSSNNHTNHAKSNSIISNGDAKAAAVAAISKGASASTNGVDRSCDKAEITEFNDDVEEEVVNLLVNLSLPVLPARRCSRSAPSDLVFGLGPQAPTSEHREPRTTSREPPGTGHLATSSLTAQINCTATLYQRWP
ncbi:hypothetical protein AWZ03_013508 [Drosophila navojoa]|uniref:Uncharacterized protein n=1 Tax=Drosophila navojoa TaxID=7232 RepID=A0A484AW23_DRONA|nr:hypothetical protein AWZ03_013508 [Drosophila navojoa]